MIRSFALATLFFALATALFADPTEEAQRVQRYHDRLQQIGTGPSTSVWVLLRNGENVKGAIEYLDAAEMTIRDEFGHRRPVLLKGIVEFTAHNQETGVKSASTNRLWRAAKLWWRNVKNGVNFSDWAPSDAFRFGIIRKSSQRGAIV